MSNIVSISKISIPTTTTVSKAFPLGNQTIIAIQIPGAPTSTSFSFEAATTFTGTYYPVYDDAGKLVKAEIGTGTRMISMDQQGRALAPFDWMRLISSSVEGTALTIHILTKRAVSGN